MQKENGFKWSSLFWTFDCVLRVGIWPTLKGFFQAKLSVCALGVVVLTPKTVRWRIQLECRRTLSPGCPSFRKLCSCVLFNPHKYSGFKYQRHIWVSCGSKQGLASLLVTFARCDLDARCTYSITAVEFLHWVGSWESAPNLTLKVLLHDF